MARWNDELRDVGYPDPTEPVPLAGTRSGWIDRDAAADLVVSILEARMSVWNTADLRGTTHGLLAQTGLHADPAARAELAQDITARAGDRCVRLLHRTDVPEHDRCLSSPQALEVGADLVAGSRDVPSCQPAGLAPVGAVWFGPTQTRPPWSGRWPATVHSWWSKAPRALGRPPPFGRSTSC